LNFSIFYTKNESFANSRTLFLFYSQAHCTVEIMLFSTTLKNHANSSASVLADRLCYSVASVCRL